ncbi:SEC-C motif domain protein [Solidesulfovibrio carbinoliphilus subsp. oakridgensis]|uniref:SEC-C motif domain protein n=1 Tax=Solidesulfovibrio carbinoliphilus subsp. oakridgensis TaxID=694327 RepID=G7QBD3_9BACT|nr:YchJ family metal-binding protein [Solidesulfovibrio carbinoliphilus]EHJ49356.1 SEC-C motif domain protein [Solidesulfovibrio carbinoliphilus subsp. oakridgensis]
MTDPCPCGSGEPFARCCGPFLSREKPAPTAEALMRSRYTAYARSDVGYLQATLLPRKRDTFNPQATLAWNADVAWTGLAIRATRDGGPGDDTGVVEFTAAFVKAGTADAIHEISRFRKKGGQWFYVDGRPGEAGEQDGEAGPEATTPKAATTPKVGRNAPCPCGSGRKYKHCCA